MDFPDSVPMQKWNSLQGGTSIIQMLLWEHHAVGGLQLFSFVAHFVAACSAVCVLSLARAYRQHCHYFNYVFC